MASRLYRVLITGIGGNIGQGVLKSLRCAKKRFYIVGIDAESLSAGFSLVDAYYRTPITTMRPFRRALESIARKERLDAIYVCSPSELEFFSSNKEELEKGLGLCVFANSLKAIRIGLDKLKTANFLRDNGFPYAETAPASDEKLVGRMVEKYGFPLILKPRLGFTSYNVFLANSKKQIEAANTLVQDLVVQRFLPDVDSEYTAGTVSGTDGKVRANIILHRYLNQGTTYRTELVQSDKISSEIIKIAETLGSVGPCNFQFRLLKGRPFVFEINPRFSGTSGIRYLYGFNDPEMVFDLLRLGVDVRQPKLRPAIVLRYWNEVRIPDVYFDDMRAKKIAHKGEQVTLRRPLKKKT